MIFIHTPPYINEIVIPEIREAIQRCPGLAGFWFDICLYVDGAFYSSYFNKLAEERLGNRDTDNQRRWQLARDLVRERCLQLDGAIKDGLPDADNYFNSLVNPGENSPHYFHKYFQYRTLQSIDAKNVQKEQEDDG